MSAIVEPLSADARRVLRWDSDGLMPAIVQDQRSGRVLMLAWMNAQALDESLHSERAVFWSRSRRCLWRKGESSGCHQSLRELRVDCDGDALLLSVDVHHGVACHTGRVSCFFQRCDGGNWAVVDPVLLDPDQLYPDSTAEVSSDDR